MVRAEPFPFMGLSGMGVEGLDDFVVMEAMSTTHDWATIHRGSHILSNASLVSGAARCRDIDLVEFLRVVVGQVSSLEANVNRETSPAPTTTRKQYDHHDLTATLPRSHQKEAEKWLSKQEERLKLLHLNDSPQS